MTNTPNFPIFKLKLKLSRPLHTNAVTKVSTSCLGNLSKSVKLQENEKSRDSIVKLLHPSSNKSNKINRKILAPVIVKTIDGFEFECYSYCSNGNMSSTYVCHISNCHKIFNSKMEWEDHVSQHKNQ